MVKPFVYLIRNHQNSHLKSIGYNLTRLVFKLARSVIRNDAQIEKYKK